LHVRAANPEEAVLLSAIARESKAHWGYDADTLRLWYQDLTIEPDDIRMHPTAVAESGSGIVGFYQLRSSTAFWILEHLWVRPRHLRQGLGSMLLNHALHVVHQSTIDRVIVASDPNAAGFYEREGGVRSGAAPAPLPGYSTRVLPIYEFRSRAV
jgi:GNAT superfamily N-acetyltransferase